MLTKIKREDCLNQYKIFPLSNYDFEKDEDNYFYPEVFRSYILTLPSKTFRGHVSSLGLELTRMVKAFDCGALIFLGDAKTPWLYQNNDYNPVKVAQNYLTANKLGKRFNGAIQPGTSELPTFIKHLAWLTRCNASLPIFHFIDSSQNILGHICKYGNLHLRTLNKHQDNLFKAFMERSKFQYTDRTGCYNWFGKSSAMPGRRIVL